MILNLVSITILLMAECMIFRACIMHGICFDDMAGSSGIMVCFVVCCCALSLALGWFFRYHGVLRGVLLCSFIGIRLVLQVSWCASWCVVVLFHWH